MEKKLTFQLSVSAFAHLNYVYWARSLGTLKSWTTCVKGHIICTQAFLWYTATPLQNIHIHLDLDLKYINVHVQHMQPI